MWRDGRAQVRKVYYVGLCLVNRDSILSVHELLKTADTLCMHLLSFIQSGQRFSAISNGKPVETFCQGWFGESCEDSSSQEDIWIKGSNPGGTGRIKDRGRDQKEG